MHGRHEYIVSPPTLSESPIGEASMLIRESTRDWPTSHDHHWALPHIPELTDFRGFATLPLSTKSDDMPKTPSNPDNPQIIPVETIQSRILLIRGHKVMLDADLAQLYQVSTGRLNEQVKRNRDRFPEDFMFELSKEELDNLKS